MTKYEFYSTVYATYRASREVYICSASPLFERSWNNGDHVALRDDAKRFLAQSRWQLRATTGNLLLLHITASSKRYYHVDQRQVRFAFLRWAVRYYSTRQDILLETA